MEQVNNYLELPSVMDLWNDVGDAFSVDFSKWINTLIADRAREVSI